MSYFSESGISPDLYTIANCAFRLLWISVFNVLCFGAYLTYVVLLRPVLWLNPDLYWWIDGYLYRWLNMTVILWMWSAGYKVAECGDDLNDVIDNESLVISNHVTNADVPTLIQWVQQKGSTQNNLMWILYISYKKTNFGPVCHSRGDFFITTGEKTRHLQGEMVRKHMIENYWPRKRKWIILFPEGDWLWRHLKKCQEYAKKRGWPILQHTTFPRVGAVKSVLDTCSPLAENPTDLKEATERPLKLMIDITIGFPDRTPLHLRTVVGGWRKPCVSTIHCRKYPIKEVPLEPDALRQWLHDRYIEKEYMLDIYHVTGKFPDEDSIRDRLPIDEVKFAENRHLVFRTRDFVASHVFFIASFFVFASAFYSLFVNTWTLLV